MPIPDLKEEHQHLYTNTSNDTRIVAYIMVSVKIIGFFICHPLALRVIIEIILGLTTKPIATVWPQKVLDSARPGSSGVENLIVYFGILVMLSEVEA